MYESDEENDSKRKLNFFKNSMLESILLQIFQAKTVKAVLSSFILIVSYLIGSFDVTLQAMFLAVVLDFLLGL